MKEELDNMDKIFREKLEGFSEEPPVFLWDNIQATLAGQRRKKRMAWYSWSAVAALLVFAFLAGWYFNETAEKVTPRVTESETVKPADKQNIIERDIPAPVTTDIEKQNETIESDRLLADATKKRSIQKIQEEKTSTSVTDFEDKETRIEIATAGLNLMEKIEKPEFKVTAQEPSFTLTKKDEPDASAEFLTWEQKMIDENTRELARITHENSGWKLGLNVSPGYSSYTAKHGATYASNMTYEANEGSANLSGGISVQYKTGKRISIESGIYYAQNGQETGSSPQLFALRAEMDYAFAPAGKNYFNTAVNLAGNRMAMNSTAGIIEFEELPRGAEIAANLESAGTYANSLLTSGELSQVFDFVEIPLYLRYLVIDRKMDVELVGGVNAGLVVGNNAYINNEFGVQNIGKTLDISTVNVSGTVGVGLNYALGKNLSVAVEPRLNYYMNSINRNSEVDFRPYRVGVYTGLYYEF
jgi:hypothetical protein